MTVAARYRIFVYHSRPGIREPLELELELGPKAPEKGLVINPNLVLVVSDFSTSLFRSEHIRSSYAAEGLPFDTCGCSCRGRSFQLRDGVVRKTH